MKNKEYYDIKVETMVPATLSYKILAESPEEAITLLTKAQPIITKYRLTGKKNKKTTVYKPGTSIMVLIINK